MRSFTRCLVKMKRLFLLAWILGGVTIAWTQPPNFVWIIADDMSPDIAAYGAKGVETPNLDRLASQGRRYTRAYATAPVCSSSRSAFILGCYQTTTGLHAHDVEKPQPLPLPYRHLPGLLREAGWFVTNAHAPGEKPKKSAAKTHYNFAHRSEEMFDGDDWKKHKPNQPFFAQFQIHQPHRPFPVPEVFDAKRLAEIKLPAHYPQHPLMLRDWYAYLRSVEVVDQRVGLILRDLEEAGELENTIVMFFADHGRPMPWGKQWLGVEGLQVPLIIRGPQVAAGGIEERLVSLIDLAPSMLEVAKLPVPSWMEGKPLLGSDFPMRSQLFAARDRCGDAEDRIRAVITPSHLFVRNFFPQQSRLNWSSYKEVSYPGMALLRVLQEKDQLTPFQLRWLNPTRPEFELYDLQKDPLGIHDQAVQQAALTQSLNQVLEGWIQSSGDRGALPAVATEPPLEEIQKDKRADYQRTWKKRLDQSEPTDQERLTWWEKTYHLSEAPGPP